MNSPPDYERAVTLLRHLADDDLLAVRGIIGQAALKSAEGWPWASAVTVVRTLPGPTLRAVIDEPASAVARRMAAAELLALEEPEVLVPEMVDVPAGESLIGTVQRLVERKAAPWLQYGLQPDWIRKEVPRHNVTVGAFRLGRFPITNAQYLLFLKEAEWPELPTGWRFGVYPFQTPSHPVWSVTLDAARAYTRWLSRKTARTFRLPSEYEWEYAASGGDGREFPWGTGFEAARCNTAELRLGTSTPVGMFPAGASPFGIHEMSGNVEEWVDTLYAPYPGGAFIADDLSANEEEYYVTRGGSFTRFGDLARCQRRHGRYPASYYPIGFRVAEDA